jgi:hypothetical protein
LIAGFLTGFQIIQSLAMKCLLRAECVKCVGARRRWQARRRACDYYTRSTVGQMVLMTVYTKAATDNIRPEILKIMKERYEITA